MKIRFISAALLSGLITISSFSQEIEWVSKASLPVKIYSGSAVTCQGKIYFLGGQIDLGSRNYIASSKTFEYDFEIDAWIEKPNMPTARFNAAVASVNNKIFAIGGDRFLNKNEMYDPTTESWHTLTPMPTARQHIKAAVVDKIYIIGGTSGPAGWLGYNTVYEGNFGESTGTAQETNKDELLIFPNPAKDYIRVRASNENSILKNFQIVTFDGRITKAGILESEQINISDLSKGVFVLYKKTEDRIMTKT